MELEDSLTVIEGFALDLAGGEGFSDLNSPEVPSALGPSIRTSALQDLNLAK